MSAGRPAAFEPPLQGRGGDAPITESSLISGQSVLPKEFLRLAPRLKQRRVINPKNAIDNLYQLNRLKPPMR